MRISLEEAQHRIIDNTNMLPPTAVSGRNALGRVLAQSIVAKMDQPPFPRSPYDGYALRAADSAGAGDSSPVSLRVVGKSFAGVPADVSVGPGECVRIMTGGVIPTGADCVVMQERTDFGEDTVLVSEQLSPYANYCRQGEDFHAGETLAAAGTKVTAAVCAVAASAGVTKFSVYPRPWVALVSTGDELQKPGSKLLPGHIFDSNAAWLSARLTELGVPFVTLDAVGDDKSRIAEALKSGVQLASFVISTGGVSVGQKDCMPAAFDAIGANTVFHGVDMKPGMPAAFATLNGTPLLALSGNPFASAVTFELLGRLIISRLTYDPQFEPLKTQGVLGLAYEKRRPCRRFLRAVLDNGVVRFPPEQQNGQMRSMIGCNCLADLPVGEAPLAVGTQVNVYML